MDSIFIFSVGFIAQALFSARILVQWILSERAKQVVSPALFWVLSILGSYLFCLYGWLRSDFSILLGQFISYYIYLWNLNEKKHWNPLPLVLKVLLVSTPVLAVVWVWKDSGLFIRDFLQNEEVPLWLVIFGSAGQVIFTLRFVYQWMYSMRCKESVLPNGFWIISLVGSLVIVTYGVLRSDPVLILGQSVGFVAYSRNLIINHRYAIRKEKNG